MKKILLIVTLVFSSAQMLAQGGSVWQKVTSNIASKTARVQPNIDKDGEHYFSLDINAFKLPLANAKDKFSKQEGVIVEFPNMEGDIETFKVWENSNMEPSFQAKFPQIRAYVGKSTKDGSTINFSVSPQGVQTILFRPNGGAEFIEAYDKQATSYVVYDTRNRNKGKLPFTCATKDTPNLVEFAENTSLNKSNNKKFITIKLALSCTAEYANYFGATAANPDQSLVLAGMNATMTRVNGVYERDLAVHMSMIDNTSIIYYNPDTDPYSAIQNVDNNGNGFDDGLDNWNYELMNTLHATPGDSAFDIGHLFGAGGGGGNAGCIGCTCSNDVTYTVDTSVTPNITSPNNYKGSGITSPSNNVPAGDSFDIDFVAHEMGHQLGGNHSFTFGYEGTVAQVEPGSGSTIMGYAGVTSYDVQAHSDPIFCYKNILQIQSSLASKTCPVKITMTDNTPVVNAGADYTIPIGTAFMLTGTATDTDATDVMTYLWEQNDIGTNAVSAANSRVLATKTVGPNFRTFKPSTNLFRYFPQMGKILSGTLAVTTGANSNWESVSNVARTLNFTFTARDNAPGGGQTATDASKVTVSAAGGPFTVTSQATAGLSYQGLSTQTVTWNVASTTAAPFSTANVDILLSINASTSLETYNATAPTSPNATTWTTIASNVPNTGTYDVILPNVTVNKTACRFMVKAVGNIFLAVNSKNFTITPALANETFGLNNFELFPNPNKGSFSIQFESISTNEINITVHDLRGRNIFERNYSNTGMIAQNLQLDNVQSGIYLVTVKDGDKKVVKKIIVD